MSTTIAVPACPRCEGPMWDNRQDKKNPKAPDFKCKKKDCLDDAGYVTALWVKDLVKQNGNAAPAAQKVAHSAGPRIPAIDDEHPAMPHEKMDTLCAAYTIAYKHAAHLAKAEFGNDASDAAVAAMAATIFIQAAQKGALIG